MPGDVDSDQLLLIRISGMHCHKCEQRVQKALAAVSGVHEVEVDFNSRLASVLVSRASADTDELLQAVQEAGYEASISPNAVTP
jgi:copper chaperone CopZ